MNVAYFTLEVPWGRTEQFILTELRTVLAHGHNVVIVPMRPFLSDTFADGSDLRPLALPLPLFALKYLASLIYWTSRRPKVVARLLSFVVTSRRGGAKRVFENAAVLPKAAYVARLLSQRGVEHIHAHWVSSPGSMALFVSCLTGIPCSLTAHRFDISRRNLLQEKIRAATFVRVISEDGRDEIVSYLPRGVDASKLITVHMGVELPPIPVRRETHRLDTHLVVVPARLAEKKGHEYLFEALAILRQRPGPKVRCLLAGDGPRRGYLEQRRQELQLGDCVEFAGQLTHKELLRLYAEGDVSAVIMPSVVVSDGDREGIPVALMEAMAYGIPVITTRTGGNAELVEGAGLLVPERDSHALAGAIEQLLSDETYTRSIAAAGRLRIEESFAVELVVQQLGRLWVDGAQSDVIEKFDAS